MNEMNFTNWENICLWFLGMHVCKILKHNLIHCYVFVLWFNCNDCVLKQMRRLCKNKLMYVWLYFFLVMYANYYEEKIKLLKMWSMYVNVM